MIWRLIANMILFHELLKSYTKRKIIWTAHVFFCLILITPLLGLSNADEYWVSYSGELVSNNPHPPGGPKFLLKIDAIGTVMIPATKVVINSQIYTSAKNPGVAINHRNSRTLNMWFTQRKDVKGKYSVFRAVIEKKPLQLLSIQKTPVSRPYTYPIQVTQLGRNDFLSLELRLQQPPFDLAFTAWSLTSGGAISGERFLLFPRSNDCEGCGSAVSADGRAFVFTDYSIDRLSKFSVMYQRLNESGRPAGKAVTVVDKSPRLDLMDVSNSLVGGRRYILYTVRPLLKDSSLLYLQVIDETTGHKINEPTRLGSNVASFQSVAVDPLGRFTIYVSSSGQTDGSLMFQQLDNLGRKMGEPKVIATKASTGVDVLKE